MLDILEHKLASWDGIHMEPLKSVYHEHLADSEFFNSLIVLTGKDPSLQDATTWLLKHHYDEKNNLSSQQINDLLKLSSTFESWPAKLHVLQMLPHIEVSENNFIAIDNFVRSCLKDDTKFVRAWAYQGLYQLYEFRPENKTELIALCEDAMNRESASIKSKVRKILAKLTKP